jgi:hypothetical protein
MAITCLKYIIAPDMIKADLIDSLKNPGYQKALGDFYNQLCDATTVDSFFANPSAHFKKLLEKQTEFQEQIPETGPSEVMTSQAEVLLPENSIMACYNRMKSTQEYKNWKSRDPFLKDDNPQGLLKEIQKYVFDILKDSHPLIDEEITNVVVLDALGLMDSEKPSHDQTTYKTLLDKVEKSLGKIQQDIDQAIQEFAMAEIITPKGHD